MSKIEYNIRNTHAGDYRTVEHVIREAFWNQYVPGCSEHYFAHMIRQHEDYVPELDYVIETDGQIAGCVIYTRSKLIDDAGEEKQILTFGPVAVLPEYQRKGLGKALLEHSFAGAEKLGYDVIVIFGSAANYVSSGFVSCKKHDVCLGDDHVYPAALLVKELKSGALDGRRWRYVESTAGECCADSKAVELFDAGFPPKEKKWQPSQEEFYISSHSMLF